jgi:hypothetical protein
VSHAVQLFDSTSSRALAVASFVRDGLRAGDRIVVITRPAAWDMAASNLTSMGVSIDEAIASGRLTVMDAEALLQLLMRDGALSQERFDELVGGLVSQQTAGGHRLRLYGDMVDLLASEGHFEAARRLEAMGNQLPAPVMLFCGYSSACFSAPQAAGALRAIRRLHTHVHLHPADVLGTSLLEAAGS